MKKTIILPLFVLLGLHAAAQAPEGQMNVKYRRSSLYTLMVDSPGLPYAEEIKKNFSNSPIPDKFNNHNLDVRVLNPGEVNLEANAESVQPTSRGGRGGSLVGATPAAPEAGGSAVVDDPRLNSIAKQLVAKWFNRSAKGGFNMELIKQRGSYDASAMDVATAKASKRGLDMLADAGEELIGKTFVLINEFKYVSKEEVAKKAAGWLSVAGALGDAVGVSNASTYTTALSAGATVAGKGYVVKTTAHLYQLVWDEATANAFYNEYWADDKTITPAKKKAFDDATIFKLKYVGSDNSWADVQSSVFTSKSEEQLVERATVKAVDAVIVKLQKNHDEFKTKTPLYSGEPICAKIGMKEGVSEKSKFDVLEQQMDPETGKTSYVVVGQVKVDTKYPIWDNRYGAEEENPGSTVDRTYFKKVSGKDFYPGMLLVQKKGK